MPSNRLFKNRFFNLERTRLYQNFSLLVRQCNQQKCQRQLNYIKKNTDKLSNINITCAGRGDGGGSQLHAQISTIIFANSLNLNYHHSPLQKVEHNYANDPNWEEKWEKYLNLGSLYEKRHLNLNYLYIDNYFMMVDQIYKAIINDRNLNIEVPYCHGYTDGFPHEFISVLSKIEENFFLNRQPRLFYKNSSFNIAIHMRRGDVTINRWTERFTSSQCIYNLRNYMRIFFRKAKPRFYIFSSSYDDDLKNLESEDTQIITNTDVFFVLDHLIYSDCLVMAKSSMSYIAGMLSRGVVLYQPFWSTCLPHWFRADGFFSDSTFHGK